VFGRRYSTKLVSRFVRILSGLRYYYFGGLTLVEEIFLMEVVTDDLTVLN
jgi:hypothetical protein